MDVSPHFDSELFPSGDWLFGGAFTSPTHARAHIHVHKYTHTHVFAHAHTHTHTKHKAGLQLSLTPPNSTPRYLLAIAGLLLSSHYSPSVPSNACHPQRVMPTTTPFLSPSSHALFSPPPSLANNRLVGSIYFLSAFLSHCRPFLSRKNVSLDVKYGNRNSNKI